VVAVLPSILWPPEPPPETAAGSDSGAVATDTAAVVAPGMDPAPPFAAAAPPAVPLEEPPAVSPEVEEERVVVSSPLYDFAFSTRGGRLVGATLNEYETFADGDSGLAQLMPSGSRFLEYGLVVGPDTMSFADWQFEPSTTDLDVADEGAVLEWTATRGPITVRLAYTFRPDHYLFEVAGTIDGLQAGTVLVGLGPRLAGVDADANWDIRSYSVVTKANKTERLDFRKLDPFESRTLDGPFEWVAIKSKYFVAAALTLDEAQPRFGGARATAQEREGSDATRTDVWASLPAPGGTFGFSVYVGPQEYHRLRRIGHELSDVTPYGWILRPIIKPFVGIIVVILLWMHETLNLGYGWVLVLFGLAVRVVLWPLNQKAMRSSMAMQAIQPEIKAVQDRYKQDPQRLQQEMKKLDKRETKVLGSRLIVGKAPLGEGQTTSGEGTGKALTTPHMVSGHWKGVWMGSTDPDRAREIGERRKVPKWVAPYPRGDLAEQIHTTYRVDLPEE